MPLSGFREGAEYDKKIVPLHSAVLIQQLTTAFILFLLSSVPLFLVAVITGLRAPLPILDCSVCTSSLAFLLLLLLRLLPVVLVVLVVLLIVPPPLLALQLPVSVDEQQIVLVAAVIPLLGIASPPVSSAPILPFLSVLPLALVLCILQVQRVRSELSASPASLQGLYLCSTSALMLRKARPQPNLPSTCSAASSLPSSHNTAANASAQERWKGRP
jgi:hypothetical protein